MLETSLLNGLPSEQTMFNNNNILINDILCTIIDIMKNKNTDFKDRGTTLFLRAAILGVAIVVALLSVWAVSDVYRHWAEDSPELAFWTYPIILVISASAALFCVAVRQIWRLLTLIDQNKAFTRMSVKAMKNVKYCGFVISALFATWMPLVFRAADNEDAPGMILIFGAVFVGIPFVIAVFAGVAQRLFQNAIDIKKENDLTV